MGCFLAALATFEPYLASLYPCSIRGLPLSCGRTVAGKRRECCGGLHTVSSAWVFVPRPALLADRRVLSLVRLKCRR